MKKSLIQRSLSSLLISCLLLSPLMAAVGDVSQVVKVGQQFTLTVTADGTTPFTYQWRKAGVAIPGATVNPYITPNAQLSADGVYTVTVANSAGSVLSNLATVTMLGAPVFTLQPVNQTLFVGNSLSLLVTVTGNPAPTYQWYKNAVLIAGATASTFSIAVVAQADAGSYTVVATSTLGGVTNSTTSAASVVTVSVSPPVITSLVITVQ